MACEVKTSFRDTPYDVYVLDRWKASVNRQLADQKSVTKACNWRHCVIVNKPWMKAEIESMKDNDRNGFDVRLNETCGSAVQPPDPLEVPVPGLD
jgi:hypothetical protein